jgi:purine-binding chemotaxis protein CheW
MSFLRNSEEKSAKNVHDVNRYLEFNLGDERFAILLLTVKEVIAVPETTKVPFTPDYFLGVMNLRGQVLSVIDMRCRMGIEPLSASAETAVIIIDLGFTHLGVVVDSINRVLAVEGHDFAPPPEIEKNARTDFITGCYKNDKHLVLFLDVNKILDHEEKEMLTQSTEKAQAG